MKTLINLIKQAWAFVCANDIPTIIRAVLSRDAHPLIQFGKYGFCGVLAVTVQVAMWIFFSQWFPNAEGLDLTKRERAINHLIANLCAFPFSNIVAYITNVLFVFEPGRHSKTREFAYFTGISFFSFIIGTMAGPFLIDRFGIPSWAAQGGLVVTSALVNFVCRKFFIFKG